MQKLVFSPKKHKDITGEWQPHRNSNEIWSWQGLARDVLRPAAQYAFRAEVQLFRVGFRDFCGVYYAFSDLQQLMAWERRLVIPNASKDKLQRLYVDANSLFVGEQVQVLLDGQSMAMRLKCEQFSLDVRWDREEPEQWLGNNGALHLVSGPSQISTLVYGHLPYLTCTGRVMLENRRLDFTGVGAMDRMWGPYPFSNAKTHWERFQLFMDNGNEYLLLCFPFGGQGLNYKLPRSGRMHTIEGGVFSAMEYMEIDEWRFGKGWKLDVPEQEGYPLFLIPLIAEQFKLPVCRPLLSVVDREGKRLGYGFGELMPGARNEIKKIPLSIYYQKKD